MNNKGPSLSAKLKAGEFIVAPGIYDMIGAVVCNKVGFDFVYASGYWSTASAYGLPDAGISTFSQMLERYSILCEVADASVIADADTGYGGLLNVHHTVKKFEEAGIVAIQIEDQEFPKKCGHTPNKRVVPTEDMVEKIKVACAARQNPDETVIIARTDARAPNGFKDAMDRGLAFQEAGADVVFIEALHSEEEMREACKIISKPMMANMADGGITPIRPWKELQDIGFQMAIFPAISSLSAAAAIEKALNTLKIYGTSQANGLEMFDFNEFNQLIGFPEVWEFEKKWAR